MANDIGLGKTRESKVKTLTSGHFTTCYIKFNKTHKDLEKNLNIN